MRYLDQLRARMAQHPSPARSSARTFDGFEGGGVNTGTAKALPSTIGTFDGFEGGVVNVNPPAADAVGGNQHSAPPPPLTPVEETFEGFVGRTVEPNPPITDAGDERLVLRPEPSKPTKGLSDLSAGFVGSTLNPVESAVAIGERVERGIDVEVRSWAANDPKADAGPSIAPTGGRVAGGGGDAIQSEAQPEPRHRYWRIALHPSGEEPRVYALSLHGEPRTASEMRATLLDHYPADQVLWVKPDTQARPMVTCGACDHFKPDRIGDGTGIGGCLAGAPLPPEAPLRYPGARRRCAWHRAREEEPART